MVTESNITKVSNFLNACSYDEKNNNVIVIFPTDENIDWNYKLLQDMVSDGYLTKVFHKYSYCHTEYFLTDKAKILITLTR